MCIYTTNNNNNNNTTNNNNDNIIINIQIHTYYIVYNHMAVSTQGEERGFRCCTAVQRLA